MTANGTTPSDTDLTTAALFGLAAGMRTFTPLAAMTLRNGGSPGTKKGLLMAAAGELVGDKLPVTPPRTDPPALAARAVAGAVCGYRVGGPRALVAGSAVAVVAAYGAQHTRQWLVRRSGRPDLQIALLEDVLAIGLAGYASSRA